MFKVGEFIVYKRDVCKIEEIKKLNNNEYYILKPIDDLSLTIDVPTDNKFGYLRQIISKEEALNLIKKIPKIDIINSHERLIENEYKNLINTEKHEDLIKIIKTAYLRNDERLKNKKKISDKDDRYFKKAENYLYNELSISLNLSFDEVKKYIIETVTAMEK